MAFELRVVPIISRTGVSILIFIYYSPVSGRFILRLLIAGTVLRSTRKGILNPDRSVILRNHSVGGAHCMRVHRSRRWEWIFRSWNSGGNERKRAKPKLGGSGKHSGAESGVGSGERKWKLKPLREPIAPQVIYKAFVFTSSYLPWL